MVLERIFDKIDEAWNAKLPFVLYSSPGGNVVRALVQKNKRLDHVADFSESGFVMAPFDSSQKAVLFAEDNIDRYSCDISENNDSASEALAIDLDFSQLNSVDRERHVELVGKGLDRIQKGDFIKVVLSRAESINIDRFDINALFLSLLSKYPGAFVYLWHHPEIGIWAGASPETLLKIKGDQFHTMSLAGTQQFKGKVDVPWGAKEIREQQIVTENIRETLEGLSLKVSETYTKRAGGLLHLCNDIQGDLNSFVDLGNLIDKLHPTAAVCGLPKERARQFILDKEGYDRSFYTGFLGEMNLVGEDSVKASGNSNTDVQTHLFVNLRCMQILQESSPQAVIYVGGGITKGSIPQDEWEETVEKSKVMKSALNS